jgi:hypothetical protein
VLLAAVELQPHMIALMSVLDGPLSQTTGSLGVYWIGLSLDATTSQYKWADGSTIGNGEVLQACISGGCKLCCIMLQTRC